MSNNQNFTITVTREELGVLVELISAANNGRAKDFHGNEIMVGFDLYEEAMTHWLHMSMGECYSCYHEQRNCDHAIDEMGNCLL